MIEENKMVVQIMVPFFGAVVCGTAMVRIFAGLIAKIVETEFSFCLMILLAFGSLMAAGGSYMISRSFEKIQDYPILTKLTKENAKLFSVLALVFIVLALI